MKITKKFDRAFQWAGEKMGSSEARTSQTDEFKALETEMNLRIDGMERMQKSMNAYVKWASKREDLFGDRERALPNGHVGRTMVTHGEDFEADSDFGNSLIAVGRANERLAGMQEQYSAEVTSSWLEALNRNLAMMRDYQNARKKLESRRLAYDSAAAKANRSKREDYRLEEEVRTSKAKFEEASDDVLRRMQDIKEVETDNLRELTGFLDAQLDFHDRCAEELRRARGDLDNIGVAPRSNGSGYGYGSSPPRTRSRKSSYVERVPEEIYEEYEPEPERPRMISRGSTRRPPPEVPTSRPAPPSRAASNASSIAPSIAPSYSSSYSHHSSRTAPERSFSGAERQNQAVSSNVANLRSQLRPTGRVNSEQASTPRDDVFADYEDASSDDSGGSPRWGGQARSVSPATSMSSWSRGSGSVAGGGSRKAPPPPPPSRAKKPAPPVPPKRDVYV